MLTVDDKPTTKNGDAWRRVCVERRFSILLVILVALLVGSPILLGFGLSAAWFDGMMSLLMLAAILSLCLERRQRLFALILGIPTITFSLGGHVLPATVGSGFLFAGHVCEVLFLFGAAILIVKSLFSEQSITFDSIFGSVCGYLFLGLGWSVLYSMLESVRPGSFDISPLLVIDGEPARALPHVLTYYSFVTLTTVGYGDINPISAATRTCAWIEAITGQFYLAIVVAAVVSMLMANQRREITSNQQRD